MCIRDRLYIDAGLTQKEGEALVGTFVVPREPFRALLGRRVSTKALDDRAGFVTLLPVSYTHLDVYKRQTQRSHGQ